MCDFGISGYLVDSVAKTMDAGCKPYMAVSGAAEELRAERCCRRAAAGTPARASDQPLECGLGTPFGGRSPGMLVKGHRGVRSGLLGTASSPPCELRAGSAVTPCCIFAVCPLGTVLFVSPRDLVLQTPPGSCCSGFIQYGALEQGENSPGYLCARCTGSAPPPQPLVHLFLGTHSVPCPYWQGCGTISGLMATKGEGW